MTEITDAIRAGVLGALSRGMSLDYAARADGIRVSEAKEIAEAAGWPDNPLGVMAEARRLRGIPRGGLPIEKVLGQPGVDNRVEPELGLQRRPRGPEGPRPDLSVAKHPRVVVSADLTSITMDGRPAMQRLEFAENADEIFAAERAKREADDLAQEVTLYVAEVDEVIDAITDEEVEQKLATLLAESITDASVVPDGTTGDGSQADPIGDIRKAADLLLGEPPISAQLNQNLAERAEQEYFGEVVQTGPTPEQGERLEDYVARVAAPIEASLTAELGVPGARVEFDTTPILEFDPDRPETYACAQPGGDCGCTGTELISCPGRALIEEDEQGPEVTTPEDVADLQRRVAEFGGVPLVADPEVPPGVALVKDGADVVAAIAIEEQADAYARETISPEFADALLALPPATDNPAPKAVKRSATRPGTVPCEGCGVGVLASWVEANGDGIQRHKHCREGA